MARIIYALQQDNLDAIAYRYFGQTTGIVEQLLELNPQLAYQPILALGTAVSIPEQHQVVQQTIKKSTIQLWD